jgi:hypothetical protein
MPPHPSWYYEQVTKSACRSPVGPTNPPAPLRLTTRTPPVPIEGESDVFSSSGDLKGIALHLRTSRVDICENLIGTIVADRLQKQRRTTSKQEKFNNLSAT